MKISDKLRNAIETKIKTKMEILKQICEEELRNAIQQWVYDKYTPEVYERQFILLNSVTSSEVIIQDNTISFKVYIDPAKMQHESMFGEKEKGIAAGEEIYVVPLVENAHGGAFYRPATPFFDKFIREIQNDLNNVMIKYVIKEFKKSSYKK